MSEQPTKLQILELTTEIVAAHLSKTSMGASDIPPFISDVYQTLASVDNKAEPQEKLQPAVPVNRSIQDDYLICLEDGKKLKMLKRHLKTAYNMSPQDYREKWNLSPDYPMVAPNYATKRSNLAKEIGLGKRGEK